MKKFTTMTENERTGFSDNVAFRAMASSGGSGTMVINQWTNPQLVQTIELQESIELVYKQNSLVGYNWGSLPARVFKIVFSCIDGKWNKSEPIYGQIIFAQDEYYDF